MFYSIFVLSLIPLVFGLLIGDKSLGTFEKLMEISLLTEVGDYKFIRFLSFENTLEA
jgi:hypothetical protein